MGGIHVKTTYPKSNTLLLRCLSSAQNTIALNTVINNNASEYRRVGS
ncbi:hypothetical protein BVRB_4g071020 [Beta vulgaris subsp. vulgaris]|nr:hypothetical protein BVRB_4g071020 [Beta vulgaris subsp. vulgaris]